MFGFGGTTLQGCPGDSAGTLQMQPILIANIDVKLGGSQFANFATPRCEIRNNDAPSFAPGGVLDAHCCPPKKTNMKSCKNTMVWTLCRDDPPGAPGGSLLRRLPPPSPRRKLHLQSAANFCRVVYTERDNNQNRVRTPPIAESKQSPGGIPQSGLQRRLQGGCPQGWG